MVVGEPAEEVGAGARAMLSYGLFRKFPRPDGDPGGVGCSHRAPVQQHLLEALRRVINAEAAASAAPKAPTIVVQDGMHSVENDPTLVTGLLPLIKGALGPANVLPGLPVMAVGPARAHRGAVLLEHARDPHATGRAGAIGASHTQLAKFCAHHQTWPAALAPCANSWPTGRKK
jgi:hypothetical protein